MSSVAAKTKAKMTGMVAATAVGWILVAGLVAALIAVAVSKVNCPKAVELSSCSTTALATVSKKPLPNGFLWGVGSAAFQIEGNLTADGRLPSIWDNFIANTATVGSPDLACNSYYQWQDDIALLKTMGAKAYRFSFAWPRIIPKGTIYNDDTGNSVNPSAVNPLGVAYYNKIIDACLAANITPIVTLYHWDLPVALQAAYNGWLCTESYATDPSNTKIVTDFVNYADVCFKTFGDRVKHWATINEPQTIAVDCYEYNWYAPGASQDPAYGKYPGTADPSGNGNAPQGYDYKSAHATLLAHAAAYRKYHATYAASQGGKVGIVCNMDWGEPFSTSADDIAAAERANVFWGGWFWDPIFFGDYPAVMKRLVTGGRLPTFTPAQSAALRGSVDMFMWNTYTTALVQNAPTQTLVGWTFDQQNNKTQVNASGFNIGALTQSGWLQIVPWGVGKALRWIQNRYSRPTPSDPAQGNANAGIVIYDTPSSSGRKLPLFITENGVDLLGEAIPTSADVGARDYQRWHDYYQQYLDQLLQAASDTGVDMGGYMAWSLMDNLEWTHGMTCRFGVTYVNFLDNKGALIPSGGPSVKLARVPKDTAMWFKTYFAKK